MRICTRQWRISLKWFVITGGLLMISPAVSATTSPEYIEGTTRVSAEEFIVLVDNTPNLAIVDSRIRDWKIRIQDTVADNASCGLFVLGDALVSPHEVDMTTCGMLLEKNGEIVATGAGAAAMGSPVNAVAWLANTLGEFGIPLEAGEVILSGSLAPLIPVEPGDSMNMRIGGIGAASVRFV